MRRLLSILAILCTFAFLGRGAGYAVTESKSFYFEKKVYSGRTSGYGEPKDIVKKRDKNHHMNKEGYEEEQLDKSSTNPDAIRGREQYLIDKNGVAQSKGGTSGNKINGVSDKNKKSENYEKARKKEFGE